jgi:hypothetical protein
LPGSDALFQSGVVEITAQAKDTPTRPFLDRSGHELVLEGRARRLLFHRRIFCLIGTKLPMNGNVGESSTCLTVRVQTRRLAAGGLSCPENRSNLCKYDDKIFQICQGGPSLSRLV